MNGIGSDPGTAPEPAATPAPAVATAPTTPPAAGAPPPQMPVTDTPSTGYVQPPARHGLLGVLDAVTNMLASRDTREVTYDDQGKHVTAGPPMSRGKQLATIGMEALTGAARGLATPPGVAHAAQGAAAGTLGGIQDVKDADDKQDATAQQTYDAQQKAKMNSINYQLGIRTIAKNDLELKAMGVKANEDAVKFSDEQIDREKTLGSYDLGMVSNAGEIADTISKLPNWQQQLYAHEGIQPHPVYNEKGDRLGLQLYLRRPNVDNQAAPEGVKVPKWVPASKPGEQPHTEYFTPVGATNGEIDKYNRAYLTDVQTYQKAQTEEDLKKAQTKTQGTEQTKNLADANKANADAAKARAVDPNSPEIAQLGEGIARGDVTEDQISGFAKMKPAIQAYLTQHHPNLDQTSVFLTGAERKQRDLANNAIHNLDDIATRLQRRPELIGKIAGRVSQGKTELGTDDRDLADINTALDNYALASTGAHGIRAVQARHDAKLALLNSFHNGPNGIDASIHAARGSLQNLASTGKAKGLDGSPYLYSEQPAGSPAAAHATATAGPPTAHNFSPSAWKAANPNGDVNAAIALAKQQGYQVVQ